MYNWSLISTAKRLAFVQALKLLIFCDTPNQAEELARLVREIGYAVSLVFTDDQISFTRAMERSDCDIALLVLSESRNQLPRLACGYKKLPPLIALTDQSAMPAGELLRAGASDVVQADDHDHIRFSIQRLLEISELQSEHDSAREQLQQHHQQLMVLLQSTTQAVAFVHDGFHVFANPAYLQLLGFASLEALQGTPLLNLVPDGTEREALAEALRSPVVDDRKNADLPLTFRTSDDQSIKYLVTLVPSFFDGEAVTQVILTREVSHTLSHSLPVPLAPRKQMTDPVTRLYSQSHMMTLLDTTISHAQDSDDQYMLYLIHLETGPDKPEYTDQCMRAAAERLVNSIESGDVLGRYSANSFILLTLHQAERQPEQVAELLRSSISNLGGLLHGRTWCRISGVIIDRYCNDSEHALSRLRNTFIEAQDAKRPVEIDVTRFIHAPGSQMMDKAWARRVSTLLQNNRLSLHSSPVISLRDDGWERIALTLNLFDENGQKLPLNRFRHTVARTGLAESVDRWIVFNASRQLAAQLASRPRLRCFIPQLGSVVQQTDLSEWLQGLIGRLHLPANSLILQVSADNALDYPAEFSRFCQSMKQLNIGICVTGHDDPTVSHELFNQSRNRIDYIAPAAWLTRGFDSDRECHETLQIITGQCHAENTLTFVSEVSSSNAVSGLWETGIDLVTGTTFSARDEHTLELDLSATLSA